MTDRMLSEQPTGCVGMRNHQHNTYPVTHTTFLTSPIAFRAMRIA